MLPIPNRLAYAFGKESEDSLYRTYHEMGGAIPGVTPEKLIIAVALKIAYWINYGVKFTGDNIDVMVFAVLGGGENTGDSLGRWKLAKTIARTGVIQTLLSPEIKKLKGN